jgi:hypothetical protein
MHRPVPHDCKACRLEKSTGQEVAQQCPQEEPGWMGHGLGSWFTWPALSICISTFSAPILHQAVQTQAQRPRKTPKDQSWERLAIRSMRLEEAALVCFPAAWELPSLCLFALLSSSYLLWRAGCAVVLDLEALDASRSGKASWNNGLGLESALRLTTTEAKPRATKDSLC